MWLTRALYEAIVTKKHSHKVLGFAHESPDKKWGRRRVKMFTAHMFGRNRNCYRLALVQMHKSLLNETKMRKERRNDFKELAQLRIEAAGKEVNNDTFHMRESLARLHVGLDTKVLANLAIWEPRTFRSIIGVCSFKERQPAEEGGLELDARGPSIETISRGHL